MKKNILLLGTIILTLLISCSKPDDGTDGIDGVNGTNGTNGVDGATGPAGPTGSANVIYSDWKTSPHQVRDTTIDGSCVRVRHLNVPELTSDALKNSVLLTYFRIGSLGPYGLPYISDAGGATNQINCIYSLNKIFVYRHTFKTCRFTSAVAPEFAGQPVMINLPQSVEYRYVIVPGVIKSAKKTAPDYSKMPYQEVCKLLNIKE